MSAWCITSATSRRKAALTLVARIADASMKSMLWSFAKFRASSGSTAFISGGESSLFPISSFVRGQGREHGRQLERLLPPPNRQRRRLSPAAEEEEAPVAMSHRLSGADVRAMPVPQWPLPNTNPGQPPPRAAPAVAFVAVRQGESCASRGLALLDAAACEALASQLPDHKFIGTTREPSEYPGCVRWGGGFVEHNGHTDERGRSCTAGGEARNGGAEPACLCSARRAS